MNNIIANFALGGTTNEEQTYNIYFVFNNDSIDFRLIICGMGYI